MPVIERTNPAGLSDPSTYGYSQFTKSTASGGLVFVSGQLGEDAEGRKSETFEDQMALAFENFDVALTAAGASRSTVLKITLLVVGHDETRLVQISRARRDFFGDYRPASTLIPVPRLAGDWMLFEVDAVALCK